MKKEKLKKVEEFLKCFSKISNEEKRDFIKGCNNSLIDCLSEACFNLLKNKHLKKNKNIVTKTKRIRRQMNWMSKSTNPCKKKRTLLQESDFGDILFDVIDNDLVPFLHKLLKNKSYE